MSYTILSRSGAVFLLYYKECSNSSNVKGALYISLLLLLKCISFTFELVTLKVWTVVSCAGYLCKRLCKFIHYVDRS